jgi:hypothetical protein
MRFRSTFGVLTFTALAGACGGDSKAEQPAQGVAGGGASAGVMATGGANAGRAGAEEQGGSAGDPKGGAALGGSAGSGAEALAPSGLLCELLRQPAVTALTDAAPEFSWIVNSPRQGAMQAAYQVLVASSQPLLDADEGDVWDSGKVMSGQSTDVEHAGSPLAAGQRYFWKVRTWEATGEQSPWSSSQELVMASGLGAYSTPRSPLVQTRVAPLELVTIAPGHYFVDFGRDAFGWLELTLMTASAGATIDVHLGEKAANGKVDTNPGGSIRYVKTQVTLKAGPNTYRVQTPKDARNTSGAAVLLPAELGVVLPFRYAEIVNGPTDLDESMLTQVVVHHPFDTEASAFESSSAELDRIWDISKYSTVITTFANVYVDGDRERIPYEGDAYLQQLGHYSVDREFALARYSHEYLLAHPTWPTEWKQHSVMMAWADWMYSGNSESLAQHYDTLAAEKTHEQLVNADGLLDTSSLEDLVDWPQGERDGHVMAGVNTVVNAFWCRNLQQMADMAGALGKADDEARYRGLATKAIAALNAKLVEPATGLYVDGGGVTHKSLHSNMLPLAFGLVPAPRRAQVLEFVKERGMACSVYGAQYLLEGLYRAGAPDAALALLTSDSDRSWLNMLRVGATITMEAWDAKYKPNLDWNHAWGAAPANILPRFVLGVQPLSPGFATVAIRPQLGGLSHAEGSVPTIRGPIHVAVDAPSGEAPIVSFSLPANVTANVALPDSAPADCQPTLDGVAASTAERDGVRWLDAVGSGSHVLTCE